MGNRLFEKIDGFVHGGDYNPDQWLDRPDILEEDIRLMKKAGINSVSLGIFSWAAYEPAEGDFHFEWLKERMDRLYENGIYTVLATPTAARPAWFDRKYPEAMRVLRDGRRERHNGRHNFCMSAPVFREKSAGIINKLIDAAGDHPGIILWHINNELSGECFCEHCVKRFRDYLRRKFDNDINRLNHEWWCSFWAHNYSSFDEIEPPYDNGEWCVLGLKLEWRRFTTWNMTDYMKSEIEILKRRTPNIPVTTNFMGFFDGLDYHELGKEIDIISWDCYPQFHNNRESVAQVLYRTAFDHALMRSMKKDKPFLLMESAPGLVNWAAYNKYKRPGIHKLFSLETAANGSDSIQYFQIRKGRGAFEQFHGAVIDHLGTDDTRVFREVADLGKTLAKIGEVTGSVIKAKAAMLVDWDTRWALQDARAMSDTTKCYVETCASLYAEFLKLGVDMDIISQEADLSGYRVLIAPMMYLVKPGTADKLKDFVKGGGQLLATYATGYVNENTLCFLGGFPGDGLNEVFGIISEEIDALYPEDENAALFTDSFLKDIASLPVRKDSQTARAKIKDYAELLRVKDAEILATYESDYVKDSAAVTVNHYGSGNAYYVAARIEADAMNMLFRKMCADAGILLRNYPDGLEVHTRENGDTKYTFYVNLTETLKVVENVSGINLINDESVSGQLALEAYEVAVVKGKSREM